MKSKTLKISIFSLICVLCLATLFVNLNNDIERKENDENTKHQEIYTIREYEGRVAVFKNTDKVPFAIYEAYTSLLPEQDRQKLKNGIQVDNTTDLQKIIEDYTS